MRLRLGRRRSLAIVAASCAVGLVGGPRPLAAEDKLILRGNYYREASTRVLAPEVIITKDLPDERLTLGVGYLLDAVSSASIAAGAAAATGGDNVFTEMRHGTTVTANSKLGNNYLGAYFRYSTESDYRARMIGATYAREILERSGMISATYSASIDRVHWIRQNIRDLRDWTSTGDSNLLQVHYLNLGYSHALHRTVLAGANLEGIVARGPQDNPYRKVLNGLDESHPLDRLRIAPSLFVRWAIPQARLVFEPRDRYYADDWGIRAHAIDARVHIRATRNLLFRLRYRYYTQSAAFFWSDDGNYPADAIYRTADPKMSKFLSHTPGAQVALKLDRVAEAVEGLHFLRGAWVMATYNHIFQTNRFGNARLGSLALSLPF